ncbi:hypothetical protein [Streptosporangium saharense]|uniref:Transcriptional regulator n=1 Tax=Streptosporangium saharense TaxID=1706840 RepID=A0A7W7QI13_9ACTN|nr:hypothetical protein [Streptosporangium saharense]MBB4913774.1 hypothetical protein [Streptosporangium saharense]
MKVGLPEWARRLRAERESRGWGRADLAREMLKAAEPYTLPGMKSIVASIKGHEVGRHRPGDPYRPLYRTIYGKSDHELFGGSPEGMIIDHASFGDLLLTGARRARPVDADHVLALRDANRHLVALDNAYGGGELVAIACRAFRNAGAGLASGRCPPAVERDLQAAVGETGEIAAWIAYDADRQALSRQLIHEAMMISRLAGDRGMELLQFSHLSMQGVYLHRSREALSLADSVIDDRRLSGRTSTLFQMRRARALAQLDERRDALKALSAAHAHLGDGVGSSDPPWAWWIDDHELAYHEAVCHGDLGSWDRAVEVIGRAVEGCEAGRTRCSFNDRAQQLDILVRAGAWREAEPVLVTLLAEVGEVGSHRTDNLLTTVADRLGRSKAALPSTLSDATAELRTRLTGG